MYRMYFVTRKIMAFEFHYGAQQIHVNNSSKRLSCISVCIISIVIMQLQKVESLNTPINKTMFIINMMSVLLAKQYIVMLIFSMQISIIKTKISYCLTLTQKATKLQKRNHICSYFMFLNFELIILFLHSYEEL